MCKTIKQKVKFKAAPNEVYRSLADTLDAYDKTIKRIDVDLVPGKRLVQAWQDRKFPEGVFSMAACVLTALKGGQTEVVLTHRGVPKELIPSVEEHWRQNIWEKMRVRLRIRG